MCWECWGPIYPAANLQDAQKFMFDMEYVQENTIHTRSGLAAWREIGIAQRKLDKILKREAEKKGGAT